MAEVDHCTGWFEGWWSHCCAAHDDAYRSGGYILDKLVSDVALGVCTAMTHGDPLSIGIGAAMAVGTALFGWLRFRYKK